MTSFTLLLLLSACGEAIETAAPPPVKARAPVKAVVEGDDEGAAYFYNPAGKRDPFQGFMSQRDQPGEDIKDGPPLQRWDVDKFTLTGVIWSIDAPRALLVDPDGLGHVVHVGTYVGRNWGKVTSISEDGVVVTEEYQTLDGELVVNPVTVRFPGEEKK